MSSVRSQEAENQLFEKLIKKYGMHKLEYKIQRMESCRNYYRRWPYDGYSKRVGMEYIDIVMPGDPLRDYIAKESRQELLTGLTDRERWVAERAEEGYKPRDMAELRGDSSSGADRWVKWSVGHKLREKLEKHD